MICFSGALLHRFIINTFDKIFEIVYTLISQNNHYQKHHRHQFPSPCPYDAHGENGKIKGTQEGSTRLCENNLMYNILYIFCWPCFSNSKICVSVSLSVCLTMPSERKELLTCGFFCKSFCDNAILPCVRKISGTMCSFAGYTVTATR